MSTTNERLSPRWPPVVAVIALALALLALGETQKNKRHLKQLEDRIEVLEPAPSK